VASDDAEIHPEHVFSRGGRIRSAAAQSKAQNVSFQQELDGYGQPWGTDMVGSLMGLCQQAISAVAMQSFTANAAAMDDYGARAQAMAGNWQQAEDTNTANAASPRKDLG
jgi:hypothetical protein